MRAPLVRIGKLSLGLMLALCLMTMTPLLLAQKGKDQQKTGRQAREERQDYYRKWLREDVVYLISEDEKEIFEKLSSADERDAFIEQFWLRRDPDHRTSINEFKEEHYRRIAYANEWFHSGEPGWKTDRGEMYIKFGPPDGKESYPNGGPYARRMDEGGGRTTVFPFERWRYNYIEGAGNNVEIEFVDPSRTGEYRIALSPQDKDALLYVSTQFAGRTEGEDMGIESRWLRITRDYGLGIASRSGHYVIHPDDFPFEKLQRLSQLQQAPVGQEVRDLRTEISAQVSYGQLPFRLDASYIRLGKDLFLAPITVEIRNHELSYKPGPSGYRAEVQIYGVVSDLSRRVWHEFQHDLANQAGSNELEAELTKGSVFQKAVQLPAGRYKVEIIAKDMVSGRLGISQAALNLPAATGLLELSPLVLADLVERYDHESESFEQFTLGGLKVVPNVPRTFTRHDTLHLYLQAYNVQLDQSALEASLEIRYFLLEKGKLALSFPDMEGRSIRYLSP
ncbi:MAG: GWxTD domain-containing protein, partial [Acidobacteriota bacterium]